MMEISHIPGCKRVCTDLPLAELLGTRGCADAAASHGGGHSFVYGTLLTTRREIVLIENAGEGNF